MKSIAMEPPLSIDSCYMALTKSTSRHNLYQLQRHRTRALRFGLLDRVETDDKVEVDGADNDDELDVVEMVLVEELVVAVVAPEVEVDVVFEDLVLSPPVEVLLDLDLDVDEDDEEDFGESVEEDEDDEAATDEVELLDNAEDVVNEDEDNVEDEVLVTIVDELVVVEVEVVVDEIDLKSMSAQNVCRVYRV